MRSSPDTAFTGCVIVSHASYLCVILYPESTLRNIKLQLVLDSPPEAISPPQNNKVFALDISVFRFSFRHFLNVHLQSSCDLKNPQITRNIVIFFIFATATNKNIS